MKFEITTILKYGLITAAMFMSIDKLIEVYFLRKKSHKISNPLNEVFFVMSNALPCCPHTADIKTVNNCKNPHCKAKLSKKIIGHIDSAKHLICIAM